MTEPLAHPLSGPLPLHLDSALSPLPVSILLSILASRMLYSSPPAPAFLSCPLIHTHVHVLICYHQESRRTLLSGIRGSG